MEHKTINGLMKHLRNDNNVRINGSIQKQQLMNTGYFHGYKGYRYYQKAGRQLPFSNYKEVYATIEYDSRLKALLYSKVMFIETAVKNVALTCIMDFVGSGSIRDMVDKAVCSYKTPNCNNRQQKQQDKLQMQNIIQKRLFDAYKKQASYICHFYNNPHRDEVPLWALFETFYMGDLAKLLSILIFPVRDEISKKLKIGKRDDANRELIYKYLYLLKDLRNAIAHNAVVFDARFRTHSPSSATGLFLMHEVGLPYMHFNHIEDYVILICYYLKALKVPKTEIKAFVRDFKKCIVDYKNVVGQNVSSVVVHSDCMRRIGTLQKFL